MKQPHLPSIIQQEAGRIHLFRNAKWNTAFLCVMALGVLLAACSSTQGSLSTAPRNGRVLQVIAAEDTWGSMISQLGGSHVSVRSVVNSPNIDPHDYESTTTDARDFAQADYVILNGVSYDSWAQKLLDANPNSNRTVLDIGSFLGKKNGDNPHFWEQPTYVEQVAHKMTADLKKIDPADSAYFTRQLQTFETSLKPYHDLVSAIQTKYVHTPIGASEALYVYQAQALNLDLITPAAYLNAENNGTEPPTSAVTEFNNQINTKQIKVMMLDVQNISNETRTLEGYVQKQQIPTVEITETLNPAGTTFQKWQIAQLTDLLYALEQQK
jgi:zinc/manganese transport system substrate-binding protein